MAESRRESLSEVVIPAKAGIHLDLGKSTLDPGVRDPGVRWDDEQRQKPVPTRLGDVVNFKRGYDLPESARRPGPYPVISSAGISGCHDQYKVRGEGIVTGRYGTLGEMHYYNGDYWPHNTALYVKDFKDNVPKYVYYLLSCLGHLNTGDKSAVPGVNRNDLHELMIPLIVESSIQQKIASVLSVLDAKIDLNHRINAELEALAKTIYDYWFVQFDFPDANGRPYKSSGGAMVWNDTLKREIPAGWEVGMLGLMVSLERGVTYGKEDVCSAPDARSSSVLRATNLSGNKIDLNDLVYINKDKVASSQKLSTLDTLIVMSSGSKEHIGKNGVYYFDEAVAFGAFCSKIVPDAKFRWFVNTFLQSRWFKSYINNQCLGTNINNLRNEHIRDCVIVKPDDFVSSLFETTVDSFYRRIKSNTVESRMLEQLRDWLLPLLMNGQVRVS